MPELGFTNEEKKKTGLSQSEWEDITRQWNYERNKLEHEFAMVNKKAGVEFHKNHPLLKFIMQISSEYAKDFMYISVGIMALLLSIRFLIGGI